MQSVFCEQIYIYVIYMLHIIYCIYKYPFTVDVSSTDTQTTETSIVFQFRIENLQNIAKIQQNRG